MRASSTTGDEGFELQCLVGALGGSEHKYQQLVERERGGDLSYNGLQWRQQSCVDQSSSTNVKIFLFFFYIFIYQTYIKPY